jgi:hypothetical protein
MTINMDTAAEKRRMNTSLKLNKVAHVFMSFTNIRSITAGVRNTPTVSRK